EAEQCVYHPPGETVVRHIRAVYQWLEEKRTTFNEGRCCGVARNTVRKLDLCVMQFRRGHDVVPLRSKWKAQYCCCLRSVERPNTMEILIRLFVWVLNRTYGRQSSGSLYGSNPMDEKVLLELEESRALEREAQRQSKVVESFKSTAVPIHGVVDYDALEWDVYERGGGTWGQIVCFRGQVIAKGIE